LQIEACDDQGVITEAAVETVFNPIDSHVIRNEYKIVTASHAVETTPTMMRNSQRARRTFFPDPLESIRVIVKIRSEGVPEFMCGLGAK
jgi:hypothetical protein